MTTQLDERRPAAPAAEVVVDVEDLCFSYLGHRAVERVDLSARAGEVLALLGTNGAGKTTTLELVLGQRRPESGRVRVLGVDPLRDGHVVRRASGVMLQEAGFVPELTVQETVRMWQSVSSRADDPDAVIDAVGMAHRRDVAVEKLSGGERRRLDVALAVWGGPRLVVLDEPTTGLDPASRAQLWDLVRGLRDAGAAVLLTTHHLEEAEALADRVAVMHEGRVAVAGTLAEVLAARPSRITAQVARTTWERWRADLPRLAGPVSATDLIGDDGPRTALEVPTPHLQDDLTALLVWARERDVRLQHLRAVAASLDEVFHAVRRGEPVGGSTRPGAGRRDPQDESQHETQDESLPETPHETRPEELR